MSKFSYLSEKIKNAEFKEDPFKHVFIEDFLKQEHLDIILSDKQIHFDEARSIRKIIKCKIFLGAQQI